MTLFSVCALAGVHDLVWDYTVSAPTENPDRGLQYGSAVNDAEGVKNGLKGIKLNSSGWCSFTNAAVPGVWKLTFGPRSGMNPASLQVYLWDGTPTGEVTLIAETCEQRSLGAQLIPLTAEQNHIFITRLLNMETVLQKIEFVEGETVERQRRWCGAVAGAGRRIGLREEEIAFARELLDYWTERGTRPLLWNRAPWLWRNRAVLFPRRERRAAKLLVSTLGAPAVRLLFGEGK